MGKTRFAEEVVESADARFLRGTSGPEAAGLRAGHRRSARVHARCAGRALGLRSAALASGVAAAGARRGDRGERPRHAVRGDPLRAGRGGGRAAGGAASRRPPVVGRRHARAPRRARRSSARAAPARARRLPLGRDPARAPAQAAAQRPAPEPFASRADARAAHRAGHGGAGRDGARRAPVPTARKSAARPHRWDPVLHRGTRRGARIRRAAATRRGGPRTGARRRGAAAADDSRCRAAAGERPVRSGPRDRGGGFGGRHSLRRRARGRARLGGRSRRAAHEWSDRGARARAAPPSGIRSRATPSTKTYRGCAAVRCTATWPQSSRRATAVRPRWRRTGSRLGTDPARSTRW